MGNSSSRLEKLLEKEDVGDQKFFGLENFGNTCYCNSVIQCLFFCEPFRRNLRAYVEDDPAAFMGKEASLLSTLAMEYHQIALHKKRFGVYAPRKFVARLRRDNEIFRSFQHQDAHEFLNYLLNTCAEILQRESSEEQGRVNTPRATINTWIHDIFQGTLANETRCLTCETVSSREENFFDLSMEITQNTSLSTCLRNFAAMEQLRGTSKYYCETCCSLQEAQKRMRLVKTPQILALHLKRFKYIEELGRLVKLNYRVSFPLELKLYNTMDESIDADRLYRLFGIVVHVGSGLNHGHFISIVYSQGYWIIFDDENVDTITEDQLMNFFGSSQELFNVNGDEQGNTELGYILFYESVEEQSGTEHTKMAQSSAGHKPVSKTNSLNGNAVVNGSANRSSSTNAAAVSHTENDPANAADVKRDSVASNSSTGASKKSRLKKKTSRLGSLRSLTTPRGSASKQQDGG
eukprot:Clim_evm15s64 gene=Clim_evmTU15s64